jgi:CBS domain-containing protein
MVEARHVLGGLTVGQAFSREARMLSPGDTLRSAVNLTLSTFQSDFPVCEGSNLVGLLTYTRLIDALNQQGPDTVVGEVMLKDITPAKPAEGLFAIQQRMAENNLDALPVADNGRFLGLITSRDIGEMYRLASIQPDLIPAIRPGSI